METFQVEGNGQVVEGGHVWTLSSYKNSDLNEELLSDDGACFDITILFLNKPIKIPLNEGSPKLVIDCGQDVYRSGKCASGFFWGKREGGLRV